MVVHDRTRGGEDRDDAVEIPHLVARLTDEIRAPLELARDRLARLDGVDPRAVADVAAALDDVERAVVDVSTLAEAHDVGAHAPVPLGVAAHRAWERVPTETTRLRIESNRLVSADPAALERILVALYENSVEHGSTGSRMHSDDAVEHGQPDGERPRVDDRPRRLLSVGGDRTPGQIVAVALSATDGGHDGLTITVGARPGGFFVEDDGIGIEPGIRDRLFEPGISGVGGPGLGLAIVERLADAHGWTVAATTGSDGGARLEFTGVEPAGPEADR